MIIHAEWLAFDASLKTAALWVLVRGPPSKFFGFIFQTIEARSSLFLRSVAAGQWMSGENTFGSTDYWFHRQYVWRIAVQLFQGGGDNPSYLAGDCELRRSLGDSTQLFLSLDKPRHQWLKTEMIGWWRGSRPLNYELTVIDDDEKSDNNISQYGRVAKGTISLDSQLSFL